MSNRFRLDVAGSLGALLIVRLLPLWAAILVPVATIAGSVFASAITGVLLVTTFKLAGFLLGLYGLLLVAVGLSNTRRLFGKPSIWSRIKELVRDVHALFVQPPAREASADQVISDFSTGWDIEIPPPRGSTLSERIEALERLTSALKTGLKDVRAEAAHKLEEARNELRAEDERLRRSVTEVGKRLEDVSVGGLDLEAVGLSWLIGGSVLSTFYEGIAEWPMWRVFVE